MHSLLREFRYATRQLLKSPGFALTAIGILALGIAATTAIFSIVEGVLLRPLPYREPARLMAVGDRIQGASIGSIDFIAATAPDIRAYVRGTHSFTSLGGFQGYSYEFSGMGDPFQVNASRLTGGVFPALGVAPVLGRVFTEQEDEQREQVAVLSYSLWQSRFHGDAQVLNKKILLDRKPYVVIGVMPRGFEFPLVAGHLNQSQLWVPMSFTSDELGSGAASWNYQMVGRLKAGITPEVAQQDAEQVAQQIMRSYPAYMSSMRISAVVRDLHEDAVSTARPLIRTLFLAVAVVLLIACANLAGLLLVRAIRRRREIAVRLALGARAAALLRQAVMESLVLSLSGGVVGLAAAAVLLRLGVNALPETLPRLNEVGLNWAVVGFAIALAVVTGLVCGLAPAFAAIRTSVNDTLKEGGRTGTAGSGHAHLRSALVIAEVAIALVLLTASGLLLRSFEKMRSVELGYQPDHTLTAAYALPQKQYATQASINTFTTQLLERLRRLPGVEAVGTTTMLPASGANSNSAFVVDGYVPPTGSNMNMAWPSSIQGDYLEALRIPLLRGRRFTDADKADSQLVILVNRKLAEHYWPGGDPVGRRIRWGMPETPTPWLTIVGEVADVKQGSPDEETREQVYQPVAQRAASFGTLGPKDALNGDYGTLALRTTLPPEQMQNALAATVRSIDPQLPLTQVQTLERTVSEIEAPRRFNTAVISAFAAAAVLLAILGIYSVIAFSAALRTQEMAIRMALGSQRSDILRLVLLSGTKLAAIGCGVGLVGAVLASRVLRSFLFGVSPFDPLVLASAAVVVLLLAGVASYLPARRSAAIDPMQSLRSE